MKMLHFKEHSIQKEKEESTNMSLSQTVKSTSAVTMEGKCQDQGVMKRAFCLSSSPNPPPSLTTRKTLDTEEGAVSKVPNWHSTPSRTPNTREIRETVPGERSSRSHETKATWWAPGCLEAEGAE
jgi:hypothetical protein